VTAEQTPRESWTTFDMFNTYITNVRRDGGDSDVFRRFSDRVVRVRRSNETEQQQETEVEPENQIDDVLDFPI
jgi:hypothetical protein